MRQSAQAPANLVRRRAAAKARRGRRLRAKTPEQHEQRQSVYQARVGVGAVRLFLLSAAIGRRLKALDRKRKREAKKARRRKATKKASA